MILKIAFAFIFGGFVSPALLTGKPIVTGVPTTIDPLVISDHFDACSNPTGSVRYERDFHDGEVWGPMKINDRLIVDGKVVLEKDAFKETELQLVHIQTVETTALKIISLVNLSYSPLNLNEIVICEEKIKGSGPKSIFQ